MFDLLSIFRRKREVNAPSVIVLPPLDRPPPRDHFVARAADALVPKEEVNALNDDEHQVGSFIKRSLMRKAKEQLR
jgi:hypothetical protein